MTEFALTLLRLAFLGGLWLFVIVTVVALRKDLVQPREARPATVPARPAKTPKPPKPSKNGRKASGIKGPALVVTEGPLNGTVIPLEGAQITIGRAPDSTLIINDDYASSRHARLYPSEGAWVIEDLGSTNGTWIDRTRITSPTVLAPGVPLRIGRTTMVLER